MSDASACNSSAKNSLASIETHKRYAYPVKLSENNETKKGFYIGDDVQYIIIDRVLNKELFPSGLHQFIRPLRNINIRTF